ncbi:MAG: dihydropteroate synthase [Firmicutes bacterium]|nr:dihydropteroate synthase [Bacillota bacterium]
MDRASFRKLAAERIIILDGAFGTELQKRGMPAGVCPEQWVLEHPDSIVTLQKEYVAAGSNAVYTCTFGGNRIKLEEFGLADQTVEINRKLALLSREAVGQAGLVAGDLSITGQFVRPFGSLPFETVVDVYKEQVKGLLEGGVDFFAIETMTDLQEARAAVIAVKESCDLPILVTMTFDEDGRTLTGADPVTALITLQSLGADAVGCNCSTGPETMVKFIRQMKPYARAPLVAKPNAGLPKLIDGKTAFTMGPAEFGAQVGPLLEAGVNLIGGCCGTSPEYIKEIKKRVDGYKPSKFGSIKYSAVTSARKTVFIGPDQPLAIIGERINPTGKKKLQEELKEGKTTEIRRFALEQIENGAVILDVNVGMPGIDEKAKMIEAVELLAPLVEAPLCFDSSSPEVLEAALRIYPGRALINSISGEKTKMAKLLPVAAKYGAMFILLPLGDGGLPETAAERVGIVEAVYKEAEKWGFTKDDIIVDGLVLTVSSNQSAAGETLKLINWASNEFKANTNIGLSNVSYGLPERKWVNAAFLAMAVANGLTAAIANPSSELLMNLKRSLDVLTGNDAGCKNYLSFFTAKIQNQESVTLNKDKDAGSSVAQIYQGVIQGDKEGIVTAVEKAIKEGYKPGELVDGYLIPAITEVGELYESKKYFLPQLIQSAEAMKKAFGYLEPLLTQSEGEQSREKIKVVMATVKGDIHDIGKNIVALMLKNHGYEVLDLGKDVAAVEIVEQAKITGAKIVGLSALMTTTMVEMKNVIDLAKKEGLNSKIIVGGAVVTEEYAKEIKADGYAEDAHKAVKLVQRLVKELNL